MRAAVVIAVLAWTSHASAQLFLPVSEVPAEGVRVDGSLREWRAIPFSTVGGGDDAQLEYALGYDQGGLYVAARVADDRFVSGEDAVVVTLALPDGSHLRGTDVWLFPGVTGRTAASAATSEAGGGHRARAPNVTIVEGPRDDRRHGYLVEAHIPWRVFAGYQRWQEGRGAVRFHDVDSESHPVAEDEPASAEVAAAHLDRLPPLRPTGGPTGLLTQFQSAQGIDGVRPRFDLRGDVAGDARPERVVLVDRFVFVGGDGYRGGRSYSFLALPVDDGPSVLTADLADLTGDGKDELVLTLRQHDARGSRVLWEAVSIGDESIRPLLQIETRKEPSGGGVITTTVNVQTRGHAPATITARPGTATGVDATGWHESPAADASPILLPWGAVTARTYAWNGTELAPTGEQTRTLPDAGTRPPPVVADTTPVPPPPPPSTQTIIDAFRHDHQVAASVRGRFDQGANVAGDAQPERLVVFGHAVVVAGPGVQHGLGYAFFDLPVTSDDDVLDVHADDVTGDGHTEILARIRQSLGDVRRESLLVYAVSDRGMRPLLSAETARERAGSRVEAVVHVVGQGPQRHLEIAPGTARGWTRETYPFTSEPSAPNLAPLVLPWDARTLSYRLEGTRLTPR